jgi:phosphoribosyl 1,2-cyclic phosphodiesterase/ActR/RegA family two-component response regulator
METAMEKQQLLHFLIIGDDEKSLEQYSTLLAQEGHKVTMVSGSAGMLDILAQIIKLKPDAVICDLLIHGLDELNLFPDTRKENISQPKFIFITGKQFDYDRRRALEAGVDGYLIKPVDPEHFVEEVMDIVVDKFVIKFWGVRGTLTVPGQKSIRYGGNTNCVTLRFGSKHFFIFDAGTGIKELSNFLVEENKFPIQAKIFISHPHYDHVNGLPFFVPLYMKGNEFEILGTNDNDLTIDKIVAGLMDSVYFPVTIKEFAANITYRNLVEEEFDVGDLHIKTILLNHPGRCLGFRVQYKNKSVCYITDNELCLENSPFYNQSEVDRLIDLVSNTNLLIMDTTYSDEEYAKKAGWGHSPVSRVIDIADKAKVQLLCLHHHDPDQTDDDIDLKLKQAQSLLKERHSSTRCIAAHEGDEISI